MADYLDGLQYEMFAKSSQFMAIYDAQNTSFKELNNAMKKRIGSTPVGPLHLVYASGDDIYLTLSGIPCRLKKLAELERNIAIVEVFPAHTKIWNQSSDLVQLTDLTSDGVWEWFPEVGFEYMSQRFWDILGYEQKDMKESPLSWMHLLRAEDSQKAADMGQRHVDSKGEVPYHATVRYTHKDGHEVHVLCRGCVVDWIPDGRPWRLLGTHTDVTDIVKKDAVESQSVFIARMSHEIRSPVCTILNECELLGNTPQTRVITQTCQQLIAQTDDILSLGKTKSEQVRLEPTAADVHGLLTDCTKRHRLQARKKGISIRLSTGDLPDTVLVDKARFNQVVDNIVGNAVKHSDSGVITIDVDYTADDSVCALRVRDQGQGIPPDMRGRVFEEFVQGEATMQGAGIGLALTKVLSKLMGGDVVIEHTQEGVGTTFLFTSILPLPMEVEGDSQKTCRMRILVVDDMSSNRAILTRRLKCIERIGLGVDEIVEARDGLDALNKFKDCRGNFQLILMDCLMPVVDGFESTVRIHEECEKYGIEPVPVVAVTASVSPNIRDKCFSHGMRFVVTKPYTEEDLLLSVQACSPK